MLWLHVSLISDWLILIEIYINCGENHKKCQQKLNPTACLGAWRGMEFIIALVLIDLYPDSLFLVSLYGLLDNGIQATLGSAMGGYIDRAERWNGARNCYVFQNVCISAAGMTMAVVLSGLMGTPGAPEEQHQVPPPLRAQPSH